MYARVKVTELKVGMFVHLTGSWLSHSFMTNRFLIKNDKQIAKIRDAGFEEVDIDLSKTECNCSSSFETFDQYDRPKADEVIEQCGEVIEQVIGSPMPAEQKAKAIYGQSAKVIKNLLESPTAESMAASRSAIQQVAKVVLSDPDTAQCLFRVSAHDYYTYTHSVSVGVYATALANQLYGSASTHDMEELAIGFFLHDLGKVNIDPAIITKPDKLTEAEFGAMKRHPVESFEIIQNCESMTKECSIISLQHHEKADGSGYPNGLTKFEIHDYAKICTVADVFDALTSNRPYRKPLTPFGALDLMIHHMSGHFDPTMLTEFIQLFHTNERARKAA